MGYFHYDGQGNVASVTDESRTEVAHYEYDAWGNLLTACGALANDFKFSTKQASTGTGLVDFGYRSYDPTTARWTQRDPLGTAGGLNLYNYVGGSPKNFGDIEGLYGYDLTSGPMPSKAGGSIHLEYNELGGKIAEWNAFVNGFAEELLEDPVVQLVGGVCQVVIGGVATWCGLPEVGVPVFAYGVSNIADAISRETGHGPYNPARDLTVGFYEFFLGMSPEDAEIAAAATEATLTLAAGVYADYALARPLGRASPSTGSSTYDDLVKAAREKYPRLAGKLQHDHHVDPIYLGGPPKGPTSVQDAAYHQVITNEFRRQWPYGTGKPTPRQHRRILRKVYREYPLE